MAIRYCVMCLADGDKTQAVCVIDIGDGEVEAGYCKPCAETMKKHGHRLKPLPPEGRKQWTKLTDAQKREIVESGVPVPQLAARYGVSEATIYNIRKKAREAQEPDILAGLDRSPEEEVAIPAPQEVAPGVPWEPETFPDSFHETLKLPPDLLEPGALLKRVQEISGVQPNAFYDSMQPEDMPPADDPDDPQPVNRNREALDRVLGEPQDAPTRWCRLCKRLPITAGILYCEPCHAELARKASVLTERSELVADNLIMFHVTEEKADRIWETSTAEKKIAFARAELLKRLEAL